ncbi:MAG: hypothetical protein NTX50_03305 [Candidatus Sumerlaeota bacterium]|nr:hypothetical protein [Candidatus Sumerlaeota bacterium]
MIPNKNPLLATFGGGWEDMLGPMYGKHGKRKETSDQSRKNPFKRIDMKRGPLHQAASRRVFPR